MNVDFDWDSDTADDIADKFREANRNLESELETAVDDIGTRIRRDASRMAPVDVGRLQSSIEFNTDGTGGTTISIRVGTPVKYGPFQEFGTGKMEAQPYLRPAFNDNIDLIENRVLQAITDAYSAAGFDVST